MLRHVQGKYTSSTSGTGKKTGEKMLPDNCLKKAIPINYWGQSIIILFLSALEE